MSIYNKHDSNSKLGNITPSYIHKKTNSVNLSSNTGRITQENNNNKYNKKNLELNVNQNNNTESNINQNINKLLTSTNRNNKKIEINLNKNYSPTTRLNKTNRDNISFLEKHIISIENIVDKFNKIELNSNEIRKFLNGIKIDKSIQDGIYRIYNENNLFIGTGVIGNKKLKRDVVIEMWEVRGERWDGEAKEH